MFEAGYYLLQIPAVPRLINGGFSIFAAAFALQILLKGPLLVALGIKLLGFRKGKSIGSIQNWIAAVCVGYISGIWVINLSNWLSMISLAGIVFLLRSVNGLGFLNSAVTMSLSVVLAIAGFYALRRTKPKLSIRLFSFALVFTGLYFVIFIVYTALVNAWKFVLLTEIWPLAFLVMGITILIAGFDTPKESLSGNAI